MNIETVEEFLFWCMMINMGIYLFTAIAIIASRDFISGIHKKMFALDDETIHKAFYNYLALYKLLIIVFNFVPWLAVWIMK